MGVTLVMGQEFIYDKNLNIIGRTSTQGDTTQMYDRNNNRNGFTKDRNNRVDLYDYNSKYIGRTPKGTKMPIINPDDINKGD